MTDDDHIKLLNALLDHPGPVFLSGYENTLYNDLLDGWTRYERPQVIETGQHRKEILWINPSAAGKSGQIALNL